MTDYYNVLGIPKTASDDEIKKAYRKKAMEFHPDRHQGSKEFEQKFKEINEAYEVLGDTQKKQQYDTRGSNQSFSRDPFADFGFNASVEDLFFNLGLGGFGFSKRRKNVVTKENISYKIPISITDVFCGCKRISEYTALRACSSCSKERQSAFCKACKGKGSISLAVRKDYIETKTCISCKGTGGGKVPDCSTCNNQGFRAEKQKLEISVPPGMTNENSMTFKEKGHEGVDGIGDLIIYFIVTPEKNFSLSGEQVCLDLPINTLDLITGSKIDIELPDKRKLNVNLPAGTQITDVVRLKEEGIPIVGKKKKSDLYIRLRPFVPKLNQETIDRIRKAIDGD